MHQGNLPDSSVIRYVSQTYLPQPFGLSFSKPGHSLRAALRQAQGERVSLRYVANQADFFQIMPIHAVAQAG